MDNPTRASFPDYRVGDQRRSLRVQEHEDSGNIAPMKTTQSQENQSKTAATSVLERMLAEPADPKRFGSPRLGPGWNAPAGREAGFTALMEAVVATWAETNGTLADGRSARLGASCLVQPAPGNRVLVWSGDDGQRWILHVLDQAENQSSRIVVARPLTITAPKSRYVPTPFTSRPKTS